jgi:predicted NAD-dependent protein-ADP-ribosyltransferase YbiA (DUF1768 family)
MEWDLDRMVIQQTGHRMQYTPLGTKPSCSSSNGHKPENPWSRKVRKPKTPGAGHLSHRFWTHEFSNFYKEPDGSFVEREFQAAKYEGHPIRQAIVRRTASPRKAKRLGRHWRLTDDELAAWNERRIDVMVALIDKKVDDNPDIAEILLNTDAPMPIVEINKHHDNFWGDCTCIRCYHIGENWLGETWMLYHDFERGPASTARSEWPDAS